MKLSIVSTLYRSSEFIDEFLERITAAAKKMAGNDFEIVLVSDGCPEDSLETAIKAAGKNKHVKIVELSRNFGHHKAMMTGLMQTVGEKVFLIDCDLEEDPEWLEDFDKQMADDQADVVFGVQESRKGGFFEKWTGHTFWAILRVLTRLDMPDDVIVVRLMTRRYVDALVQHQEREVFLAGLWAITGFKQTVRVVKKGSRPETTYTLRRKVSQLINSITSFSNLPLIGIFIMGCVISGFSGLYVVYLVLNWLFSAVPPDGYTSLMASIWLIGGILVLSVGVVGLYLSKIFSEVKQRPYTIIKQIYDHKNVKGKS